MKFTQLRKLIALCLIVSFIVSGITPTMVKAEMETNHNVLLWMPGSTVIQEEDMVIYLDRMQTFYQNYGTVSKLTNSHLTEEAINNVDLLWVFLPNEDFIASDIELLKTYLRTGARIVFCGENNSWVPEINVRISDAVAQMGGDFTVLGTNHTKPVMGVLSSESNINHSSNLTKGLLGYFFNYAADMSYSGSTQVVIADDDNIPLVVDQAVGNGRITLITDIINWDPIRLELTEYGNNQVFFENLLLDSIANKQIVTDGGNPNSGFGGSPSYKVTANEASFAPGSTQTYTFTVEYKVAQGSTATFTNDQFDDNDVFVTNGSGTRYVIAKDTTVGEGAGIVSGAGTGDVVVKYAVTTPDGTWDSEDDGIYTIGINNSAVQDTDHKQVSGNTAAASYRIAITTNPTPPITSEPTIIVVPTVAPAPTTKPSDAATKTEEVVVDVKAGTTEDNASTVSITRKTDANGNKSDTIIYSEEKAKETISNLVESRKNLARIVIPDVKDEVTETKVTIPTTSVGLIAGNKINLQIDTENAKISVPNTSLQLADAALDNSLFFHLVPIKKEEEKQEVMKRAKQESIFTIAVGNSEVTVVGRPMTIETNMPSSPVDITLPLTGISIPTDKTERGEFLNKLAVYIEHSDGEKELVRGEIVVYRKGVYGIIFGINKFSTFTIVQADSLLQDNANTPSISKTIIIATTNDYTDAYAGQVLAKKLGGKVVSCNYTDSDVKRISTYITKNYSKNDKIYILGMEKAVKYDFEDLLATKGYKNIIRIGGVDKFETAKKISEKINPKKGTTVVLVNGEILPNDFTGINNMCVDNEYPVLYVKKNSVTASTINALKAINPSRIYIVGNKSDVSSNVVKELQKKLGITSNKIIRVNSSEAMTAK